VLAALEAVERYVAVQPTSPAQQAAETAMAVATQAVAHDVERDAGGQPHLRQGVAPDRRISMEDGEMRRGRKTASQLVDGFKRHVGRDLGNVSYSDRRTAGVNKRHATQGFECGRSPR
jgi:hypothetical protein